MPVLKDNFQEIYSSLHESPSHQLHLVANYSGTHIYHSTKGWGRLWCWIYKISHTLFRHNPRLSKLKQAICYTHKIFQEQLAILEIHIEKYQQYLKQTSCGYPFEENSIHESRKAINIWKNSTKKFISYFEAHPHKKMLQLMRNSLSTFPAFTISFDKNAKICTHIITLEGITGAPLPLIPIKNLFKQKTLHPSDVQTLKAWIEKLNKNKAHLNTIHKGISALTAFFNSQRNNKIKQNYQPETLEIYLENNGCGVFEQNDPKQISWRNQTWKPNSQITVGKKTFPIGKLVGHTQPQTADNTLIFELPSLPKNLAIVPPNRHKLSLTSFKPITFPLPCAEIVKIMDKGRWGLIEHLSPIQSTTWKCKTSSILNADLPKAHALVAFAKICIQTNCTPSNLSLSQLMFDKQGNLKSLYPVNKDVFNFNALENFIYRASAGNPTIFQYLMKNSGLKEHAIAKYYSAIALSTIKKENVNIKNLGGVYSISDPKIIENAHRLTKQLLQIQSKLTKNLQNRFPKLQSEILTSKIAQNLLTHHQNSCAASFLWPTLAKSIIKTFSHF